ncbi:MAG: hypothetical protein ACI8ZM_004723 [Crocinitomix sp.]|jgi:hypothetical protein
MNNTEIYNVLDNISFQYDKSDRHDLIFSDQEAIRLFLNKHQISFEVRNNKVYVDKLDLPFKFFINRQEFIDTCKEKDSNYDIVIKNYSNDNTLIYTNGITKINGETSNSFLIENSKAYFQSKNLFKDLNQKRNDDFEFVDFFSESNRNIIFSSLVEKKRLKFEFKNAGAFELSETIDFLSLVNKFEKSLKEDSKLFPMFLKNAMIAKLINETGDKYIAFFSNIDGILLDAKINLNVYLQGLSLDKIKTEYKEYKQKYFASQSDILSKITSQIIALPVSIAASAFALYKLEDHPLPLSIVAIGLLIYIFYVSFLAKIFVVDVDNLEIGIKHDFELLSQQPFFIDHSDELVFFTNIKSSLIKRLKNLLFGLKFLTISVWAVSSSLILYATMLLWKWKLEDVTVGGGIIFLSIFLMASFTVYTLVLFKRNVDFGDNQLS